MKPILYVDGYNVIGAWPQAEREQWPLDESRDRLIHLLEDYAGYSGQEVVLVFDGHHSDRPLSTVETRPGLTLVYTRHGWVSAVTAVPLYTLLAGCFFL